MDWMLTPYRSFGPIQFGMSKEKVGALIGEPRRKRTVSNIDIETRALELPKVYYKEGIVVEVELYSDVANLIIDGLSFSDGNIDQAKSYLLAQGGVYEGAGVFVYFELGISTNMFHTSSAWSIAAFAKGYWDHNIPNLIKVS